MPWLERRRRRREAERWRRQNQQRLLGALGDGGAAQALEDSVDGTTGRAAGAPSAPPPPPPRVTTPPAAVSTDPDGAGTGPADAGGDATGASDPTAAGARDGGAATDEAGSGAGGDADGPPSRPSVPVDLGEVAPDELQRAIRRVVSRALAEDLGHRGDVTSTTTVPVGARGTGVLVAREGGVLAGLDAVTEVARQVDARIEVELLAEEGDRVEPGDVVARIRGPLRTLLAAERTILNIVCQLSGVATVTATYAERLAGLDCVVRDTRKTTPGLRVLEKHAVAVGGGANHRVGLFDAILVKENHVAAAGGVAAAARSALDGAPDGVHVQVEVTSIAEAEEAIAEGVEDLLLDNFTPGELRVAVAAIAGRAAVEASGGITLETARAYAEAGADRLAVGALTHSAPALDLALDVTEVRTATTEDGGAPAEEDAATDAEDGAAPGAEDGAAPGADGPAGDVAGWHEGRPWTLDEDDEDAYRVDRAPYDDDFPGEDGGTRAEPTAEGDTSLGDPVERMAGTSASGDRQSAGEDRRGGAPPSQSGRSAGTTGWG